MRVIKRYSNRKLYDTQSRSYITLDVIGEIIRGGDKCKVIDNESGNDITSITLTQVLIEEVKKAESNMPLFVLEALVRLGFESASIDKLLLWDDELNNHIQDMILKGEILESTGKQLYTSLIKYFHIINLCHWTNEQHIPDPFSLLGIPTRKDWRELSEQVDALKQKLDSYDSMKEI